MSLNSENLKAEVKIISAITMITTCISNIKNEEFISVTGEKILFAE
jgi:hypothetical protein